MVIVCDRSSKCGLSSTVSVAVPLESIWSVPTFGMDIVVLAFAIRGATARPSKNAVTIAITVNDLCATGFIMFSPVMTFLRDAAFECHCGTIV
jgi:hypothetical protein